MSMFNGNTINSMPAPITPNQQVVIPQITIPQGFQTTPTVSGPPYNQITVKNKEAAKNLKFPPKSRVAIFEEDNPIFYYKEIDEYGNEIAFKTCTYSELEDPPEPEYLTVQEFRKSLDEFAQKLKEELVDGKSVQSQNSGKQTFNKQQSGSTNAYNK